MKELPEFYSGLAAGISASIPIPAMLETLHRPDLAKLADGRPLADVLERGGLPRVDVEVVRAAETTGRLETALKDLAKRAQERRALERRVLAAVLYPLVVVHVAVIVPWVVGWIFHGATILSLVTNLVALWAGIAVVVALLKSSAAESLPLAGPVALDLSLARFCEALSAATNAAVPIPRAFELAAGAAGGATRRKALQVAAGDLGRPLSESLAPILPPLDLAMLESGEISGQTDRMLDKIAQRHRDDASHRLRKIVAVLPVVLFLAVAGLMLAQMFSLAPWFFQGKTPVPAP